MPVRPASILKQLCCVLALCLVCGAAGSGQAGQSGDEGVRVVDQGSAYTLSNHFVTATVSKTTGDLVSLRYGGVEMMGYVSGHHAGYWEQNPSGAAQLESSVTINPASVKGERGEVSVKGISQGESLNAHPRPDPALALEDASTQLQNRRPGPPPGSGRLANAGTATGRQGGSGAGRARGPIVDMEIRYSLGRSDRGLYTYAIFSHPAGYGATQLGESRFGMKLNQQVFDWLSIDAQRNERMPNGVDWDNGTELNMKEARRLTTGIHKGRVEHKYDYCADQFETPAFGWTSTRHHFGLFFVNPSSEFLSSGPFHFELTGHLDDGDGGDPTLLDYWRGTHYGGSELSIAAGEEWSKVVGPILLYVATGSDPDAIFSQAKAQARVEQEKWPYPWVKSPEYIQAAQRATVAGQIVLRDPQATTEKLPHLCVGLAYPDQPAPVNPDSAPGDRVGRPGFQRQPLTWQNDAKHYEFWVHAGEDGRFQIPKVRPGHYELHAIADGVLGEYQKADVDVRAGQDLELGRLEWTPVRYGRQLWQIGVPDRSAGEFLMGADHWQWGLYLKYAAQFPQDITYTVGKSDWHKDWFIYQVPHAEADDGTGRGRGRATPWTVVFTIEGKEALHGEAVLRLGLSGVSARELDISVNDQPAGQIRDLVYNATINRDGVEGSWVEKDLRFDAALLHGGTNKLTITVPAGGVTAGVAYDVVRLELAPGKDRANR